MKPKDARHTTCGNPLKKVDPRGGRISAHGLPTRRKSYPRVRTAQERSPMAVVLPFQPILKVRSVPPSGLAGVVARGTFEYAASQGGRAIEPPAFLRSSYEPSQAWQPPDCPEAPVNDRFEPFWTHLGLISGLSEMRRPEGVRARPPFVAILSVRSDPWRS